MSDKELVELVARAISLELKRQWDGQEIVKELNDPTSWSAEGGVIDLILIARALIDTMRANGYVHIDELIERARKGMVEGSFTSQEESRFAFEWLKQFKVEGE